MMLLYPVGGYWISVGVVFMGFMVVCNGFCVGICIHSVRFFCLSLRFFVF